MLATGIEPPAPGDPRPRRERWRHLDLGATRSVIECELRQLRCPHYGVRTGRLTMTLGPKREAFALNHPLAPRRLPARRVDRRWREGRRYREAARGVDVHTADAGAATGSGSCCASLKPTHRPPSCASTRSPTARSTPSPQGCSRSSGHRRSRRSSRASAPRRGGWRRAPRSREPTSWWAGRKSASKIGSSTILAAAITSLSATQGMPRASAGEKIESGVTVAA
jgi:hypothetical protein